MSELSIAAARAAVMIYDVPNKKWVPSGSSSGLSKVHIYQHSLNNTFRVVGRKLQDHEVVINCAILKGLKYNQATPTFHQWRDNKQIYGLNFSSKDDADIFASAMLRAIEIVNNSVGGLSQEHGIPVSQQGVYQYVNGPSSDYEDVDYQRIRRQGMWDDNAAMSRQMMGQPAPALPVSSHSMSGPPTPASTPGTIQQNSAPPATGTHPGHHQRTSSAPPAPAPAPPPPPPPPPATVPPAPPAPPLPPTSTIPSKAPPPPPPPPSGQGSGQGSGIYNSSSCDDDIGGGQGSLAMALANAKLRRTSKVSGVETTENQYGTLKGGNSNSERLQLGGMTSIMDEMAKTLARRRAAAENQGGIPDGEITPDGKRSMEKSNGTNSRNATNGGPESPKMSRRQRFGSISGAEDIKMNGNGDSYDLERLKLEIMAEMKREMQKVKQEIIDAIKMELNRR